MKRWVALLTAFLLSLLPASTLASQGEGKEIMPLTVKTIQDPDGANGGLVHARYQRGVLLLDYSGIPAEGTIELEFTFENHRGEPMPGESKYMFLQDVDGALEDSQEGARVTGQDAAVLSLRVNPRTSWLILRADAEDALYVSRRIPVIWRRVAAGSPVRVESIWPGKDLNLAVGQEVTLDIEPYTPYGYMRLTLEVVGYDNYVIATGMTLRGMTQGQSTVLIVNGEGQPIDALEVTVGKIRGDYPLVKPLQAATHTILAPLSPVYAEPDKAKAPAGALFQGMEVYAALSQASSGWTQLDNGLWIESKYLRKMK